MGDQEKPAVDLKQAVAVRGLGHQGLTHRIEQGLHVPIIELSRGVLAALDLGNLVLDAEEGAVGQGPLLHPPVGVADADLGSGVGGGHFFRGHGGRGFGEGH